MPVVVGLSVAFRFVSVFLVAVLIPPFLLGRKHPGHRPGGPQPEHGGDH
jgi:hypothetical protein